MSNLVVGYTCQDHLLLDLDDIDYWKTYRIALLIQEYNPSVGACLIVHSSKWHYHLVFDNRLPWETIVRIIEMCAALGIVQKEYATVRTFRRDLTLRVSAKNGADRFRLPPEPVAYVLPDSRRQPIYGIPRYLRLLNNFIDMKKFEWIHEWIIG